MTQSTTDAQLARSIAEEAGALLLDLRRQGLQPDSGVRGDKEANALILARLAAARPDDAFLSEETDCEGTRLDRSRVWIVDPLDGTREFSEGRDDWAVHIALAIDGAPAVGAVAMPAIGFVAASDAPPRGVVLGAPLRMVVSRSRPPSQALAVAEALGAELIPMGSAGAKVCAVLRGEADLYVHAGGQFEWDSCAPVAVALAAGLHASRLDAAPLVYNRADPYLPDLIVAHPAIAARALALLGGGA